MIERILEKRFREQLMSTFKDIMNQKKREEVKSFRQDEERIKRDLLTSIDPYCKDVQLDDFLVAGIDGSGNSRFMRFDDAQVHLLTSATIVLNTGTADGRLLHSVDPEKLVAIYKAPQPIIDMHWHTGERDDARSKMAESLGEFYPVKDIRRIVLPFFEDKLNVGISSFADLKDTEYKKYMKDLVSMVSLITRGQSLTNDAIHDELRKVFEYSAARRLLGSDLAPRYLLIDGALSTFIHYSRDYPSMPSGFILRELCKTARERGTIICAISKDHTVPFAHQIAELAKESFGGYKKWFCRLPAGGKSGLRLRIYEDRTYIPPKLAIPYLFSFSQDNRPSRIDFDLVWWEEQIYDEDPDKLRENERALFRDLEFISRDARWYGYPVPLALAHERCVLTYKDLKIAREIARSALRAVGFRGRDSTSQRSDYNV
ncbi:MAG: DNA double-strand break repair nuclease NurA [Candidatus Thorarchaeota archaeon]